MNLDGQDGVDTTVSAGDSGDASGTAHPKLVR